MPSGPDCAITQILQAVDHGDHRAADELLPLVYSQLRRLARSKMRQERPGQTLQPTALVHEAYLRVVGGEDPGWSSRGHFFAAAALAMRRILLNQARRKGRIKHGGENPKVDIDAAELPIELPSEDLLDVDDALQELEAADPRKREIVNLRYFAGLTVEETASAMGLSTGTIQREWRFIKVWLQRALGKDVMS